MSKSFLTALLLIGLSAGAARANFLWKVTPPVGADLDIKYSNFEFVEDGVTHQVIAGPDSPGDLLRGIFRVGEIKDAVTGDQYWAWDWKNDKTQALVGYFDGYSSLTGLPGAPPPTVDVEFRGGTVKIFDAPSTTTYNPRYNVNDGGAIGHGAGYDMAVNPTYALWLDMVGVGGISPLNLQATLHSSISATNPVTGTGSGYLSIVGGAAQSWFAVDGADPSNSVPGNQDFLLHSDIKGNKAYGINPAVWPVNSEDPLTGRFVPEPASIVLLGVLVGAGLIAIRRRRTA